MKISIYSFIKCQDGARSRISELLKDDGTWIYEFEPQRSITNKQWLCKNQARPAIVKEQKAREKVSNALFLNSDRLIVTGKFYKSNLVSKIKHEKSKHATDLRGWCLIHNNACAHKYKLVQDFLETETVAQLHHPFYSSDLSPFPVYFTEKCSLKTSILVPKCSWQCNVSVSAGCAQNSLLIWIQSLDFTTRNCVSVKGEHINRLI